MDVSSAARVPVAAPVISPNPTPVVDAAAVPMPPAPSTTAPHPVATGHDWKIHTDGDAVNAIVDAISGAKQIVNAEFFGIADAGNGARVTDALVDRAKAGVEVNVIADQVSVVSLPLGSFQSFQRKIEGAGGHIIVNSRLPWSSKVKEYPALKHVDHRKVVTIDGTRGFTGGMNFETISDGYHDAMVELTGPAAAKLGAEELDRWQRVGGDVTARHAKSVSDALKANPEDPADPNAIHILANAPEQKRYELSKHMAESIDKAQDRIVVTSPAFTDTPMIEKLEAAAKRGVDVTVIGSGAAPVGVPLINWLSRAHFKDLIASGAKVFETPEVLHMKAMVADGEATLSSYNITNRSRQHDHEIGVTSADPDFTKALATLLATDAGRSKELTPDDLRGMSTKIGSILVDKLNFTY